MRTREPLGRLVLAAVFALLALNAWAQVALVLIGAAAGATAWGSRAGSRGAPVAAVAYGAVTAAMFLALAPLLNLPTDARGGLWVGGATVLLFALGCAWYLSRPPRRL